MAFKDFDAEREQRWQDEGLTEFALGGDRYTVQPVIDPLALSKFEKLQNEELTDEEAMPLLDEMIELIILPTQKEQWEAARARTLKDLIDDPNPTTAEVIKASKRLIGANEVLRLMEWIIEDATARPTEASESSLAGRENTSTSLTERSDSEESTLDLSTSAA